MHGLSYACVYTRGVGHTTDSESAQPFWLWKTQKLFLCSWPFGSRTLDLWISSPALWPLSQPVTPFDHYHTRPFGPLAINRLNRTKPGWNSILNPDIFHKVVTHFVWVFFLIPGKFELPSLGNTDEQPSVVYLSTCHDVRWFCEFRDIGDILRER